ncbi:MAG: FAD synthetase family protein [Chlamydiales bacterium]|nr:FAD synthetase family protein [Chlamydiales bacterium]
MILLETLAPISDLPPPIGLSMGTFDGLHLGHQALFHFLKTKTQSIAVFTFQNHPLQYLHPEKPLHMLCTLEHKIKLFQELDIDLLFLVPFDKSWAEMPYDTFLNLLQKNLPFSHLALGDGASFGKNREGTPEKIQALAKTLHFQVDYLSKVCKKGSPISSQRIRKALEKGLFSEVAELLGRPYSIYRTLPHIQIHTPHSASLKLPHLCLPPDGTYPVQIHSGPSITSCTAQICNQTKTIELKTLKSYFENSQKAIELFF